MTETSSPLPEQDRFGAVRDTRQLCALDRRTDRIVYLPEGGADEFRADCDAGHLICPVPRCGDPRYLAVGGPIRRHHFRHRTAGLPPHDTRAWYHLTAKLLLGQHLRDLHPELSITVDESAQDGNETPDILIRPPGRRSDCDRGPVRPTHSRALERPSRAQLHGVAQE